MKALLSTIIVILSITCFSSVAHSSILIGNVDNTGSYIITAPTTQLDSIFLNQPIFADWIPSDYEITYDSITALYHLQATGNGVGPNLGNKAAIRVSLFESDGIFSFDEAETSETDIVNPSVK